MARARSKCCSEALDRGVLPGVPNDSNPSSSSRAPYGILDRVLDIFLWSRIRTLGICDSCASRPVAVDDPPPFRDDATNPVPTLSVEGKADGGVTNLSPRALDGEKKSATVPEASPSPSLTPPPGARKPAA